MISVLEGLSEINYHLYPIFRPLNLVMRSSFSFTPILVVIILAIGFILDAETGGYAQFWWVPILFILLTAAIWQPFQNLSTVLHLAVSGGITFTLLGIIVFLDDTMTIYLVGAILLFGLLGIRYYNGKIQKVLRKEIILVFLAIMLSLIWLPISINRVVVTLPNLSAGTYITIHKSMDDKPILDSRFYNYIDDHLRLPIHLGTQIYFQSPHDAPLLSIETLRERIVIRILSISYQYRLGFADLSFFEMDGEGLLALEQLNPNAAYRLQMDENALLIDNLNTEKPALVQLPHMDDHNISILEGLLVRAARVVFWCVICFALIFLCPSRREESNED